MNVQNLAGISAILLSIQVCSAATNTRPFVSPMFGDNMVLQRGKPNPIWGWAEPGTKVDVQAGDSKTSATAGADGRWEALLQTLPTGGPYTLTISGSQKLSFTNVLVGDIWLCGGQSNMEQALNQSEGGEQAVQAANHPEIRLFNVAHTPGYAPKELTRGTWKVCTPRSVTEEGGVSAVGYYFALKIRAETNVPIGLIKDCWGGTPAESWAGAETLRRLKDFDVALDEIERLHSKGVPEHGNFITHWYEEYDLGQRENWFAPGFDDSGWKTVILTNAFRELGVPDAPSVCYFRRHIVLPDPLPSGSARILLGIVERMDTVQVNGRFVGASAWVENPRNYNVPQNVLKPGTNTIVLRILKTRKDGGFQSGPDSLKLVVGDKEIPLTDEWKGRVSVDARPPHPLPAGYENWPTMPTVLYNGMILPVAPLAIAGAIWYQGESNVGRAQQYRKLLSAVIGDWRQAFRDQNMPFYIVSLAGFTQRRDVPGDDGWAELREAQAGVASSVHNSGLAVTIDIGDPADIHPRNKKDVGERLALIALANHYGRKVVFSGPTFASAEKIPGALKLRFKHTDGGLVVKGDKLGEFSIAGKDRKWFWAEARIEGDSVIVSSPQVPEPEHARYAWQGYPLATLYNGAGLPAVPFRTDQPVEEK